MLRAKFKNGQKVFAVMHTSNMRERHVNCDVCDSTGYVKVEGKSGKFICPSCHGRTVTEGYEYKYKISYYEATIGKVEIQEYAKKYKNQYKSEVRYMLEETGVGSGTIWREERLFATEEEARDFCEKYVPVDYYDTRAILK